MPGFEQLYGRKHWPGATSKGNQCPEYPERSNLFRKVCGLHHVRGLTPMCCCAQYEHIELLRKAVRKRISESRALKKSLALVAKHADSEHKLYRCGSCG